MRSILLFCFFFVTICSAQIPRYNITISKAVEESLRTRDPFSDNYLPAKFDYNDTIWSDVKVRYKGHANRYFPKKPIRVRFSKKHLFQKALDLNLNSMYTDKSFLREKIAWDLFANMGTLAPQAYYAHLSLNNVPQGLYLSVEKVDKYFLANRGRFVFNDKLKAEFRGIFEELNRRFR